MERVILIADDAVMNRVLVRSVLNSKLPSAVIYEAENGLEVLEIVRTREVHLIILDLIMPYMDGYQTLVELKKDERYRDIPVIVNSSISEIQSIERTLKDGAIDYFIKPLSPDEMQIILPLKAKNALVYYEQNKTIHDLNRRINDELKNANAFAKYMLPKPGNFDELDLYIKYQPSMGIGGDFFDCVKENEKIWFMIADVTGHGIAAGMAASMLKILFRTTVERPDLSPQEVLAHINKEIFQIFDRGEKMSYIAFTAFLGCVHKHKLVYSNAGQPYPLVFNQKAMDLQFCKQNGPPLGILEGVRFTDSELELSPGDGLFLYTDGLFSGSKNGDFKNWGKVQEHSVEFMPDMDLHPETFLRKINGSFREAHLDEHGNLIDDVAMALIKIK